MFVLGMLAFLLKSKDVADLRSESSFVGFFKPRPKLTFAREPAQNANLPFSLFVACVCCRHFTNYLRQRADSRSIGSAKGALQLAHLTKSISKMTITANIVPAPARKAITAIVI